MFFFAIVITPFLALFAGTAVEHITLSSRYSLLAGLLGGPLLLGVTLPMVERAQLKRRAASLRPLWIYGAVVFLCGCLLLLGVFLRRP
jgi:hypothetical protein